MAAIRIQKANAIIFQLVRTDLKKASGGTGRKWEEVQVVPLAVKPKDLTYNYGSRSAIMQTTPEEGFIDKYGQKLPQVTMSGTFGIQPRRAGTSFKDGYTRLLEFRDEIFKRSQQARPVKGDSTMGLKYGADDDGTSYVYGVNFYDFIHDEQYSVNLDTFRIQADAQRNPFEPTYSLGFTCLGNPIKTESQDPMLQVLLFTSKTIDGALKAIDSVNSAIANSWAGTVAGYGVGAYDTGSGLYDEVKAVGGMYGNALSGVANIPTLTWGLGLMAVVATELAESLSAGAEARAAQEFATVRQ